MSVAWNLYKKMKGEGGEDLAVCKICAKTLKVPRSKTTTNMLSHFRESHKEDMIEAEKQTSSREKKVIESQTKLNDLFKRKMNLATKRSLDRKVSLLIARDSLSLNVVALDAFKDLLSSLNSAYSPLCRKTILHSDAVLEKKFRESIGRLGIPLERINYIVADGASVMKLMASNLDLRYVHIINLAVRAALEFDAVKAAIGNVKRIVSKMNRSANVKSLYKRLLKEAGLPIVLPEMDFPTTRGVVLVTDTQLRQQNYPENPFPRNHTHRHARDPPPRLQILYKNVIDPLERKIRVVISIKEQTLPINIRDEMRNILRLITI
ncbi:hypothetical protein Aduo_018581 [Ancylostoma duodenale]